MKTALTIAGSDSSGGAGIQADIKTMMANGVYAMSAITALTAQNTTGVAAIQNATAEFLGQELDSIFTDIFPDAVKIGMVSESDLIRMIAKKLRQYQAKNIVVDPVMVATSGARLISEEAVEVLKEELKHTLKDGPEEILKDAAQTANHKLIEKADEDINLEGMGTTLVAATVIDHTLYFINVGDSRLYLLNKDIRQLSRDHSLVEEMVRLGGINEEEARHHPDKNIITRAIGVKEDVEADFYEFSLKKGDIILMCSDGLSNMIEDEEIFAIVKGARDIVEAGQNLIDRANENGGNDNISVVLAEPFSDEVSIW